MYLLRALSQQTAVPQGCISVETECSGQQAMCDLCGIELKMWEFNEEALKFYESVGFTTYRRYTELKL